MNSADWLSHRVCATQHFLTIWIKYIFLCIQVVSVPQSILSNIETDVLKWFFLLRIRNKFLREIFFVLVFSQRAVDVASEWFAWSLALLFHCDFFLYLNMIHWSSAGCCAINFLLRFSTTSAHVGRHQEKYRGGGMIMHNFCNVCRKAPIYIAFFRPALLVLWV